MVTLSVALGIIATPTSECSSSSSTSSSIMTRVALLVSALTAVCYGIIPDIVDSGIRHIPGDDYDVFVEVEQLPADPQQKPEDGLYQVGLKRFT